MKKRLILGFVCAVILFILVVSNHNEVLTRVTDDIDCYGKKYDNGIQTFDWKLEPPIPGKNIFFHETSCFGEEGASLKARQACAVESAARMNPNFTVYLLFVSPLPFSNASKGIVNQLLSYKNIKVRNISPSEYVKDTPIDEWYHSGVLKQSKWPNSHLSDVLRYLTLWKFGGIYLDLDVVVTTSLEKITNFAGAEDWEDIAAGVIGFDESPFGRRIADLCLRDLKKNFKGNDWGNNGPGVITRIAKKICATKEIKDMTVSRCQGFRIFPPSAFYPIYFRKWKQYFEMKDKEETMKKIDKALVIHVWNKLSKDEEVRVDSEVPYAEIARKYCPKVFSNCGKVF